MPFLVDFNFWETKSQESSFYARPFCDKYHHVSNVKQADKELWITPVSLPH